MSAITREETSNSRITIGRRLMGINDNSATAAFVARSNLTELLAREVFAGREDAYQLAGRVVAELTALVVAMTPAEDAQ